MQAATSVGAVRRRPPPPFPQHLNPRHLSPPSTIFSPGPQYSFLVMLSCGQIGGGRVRNTGAGGEGNCVSE